MRSYQDTGIVIKMRTLREADKLVVIFSREHGRIEAVAKGISKILSHKGGTLDLLNQVRCSFHMGSGLDLITEAELIKDYESIKTDLPSVSRIFYLLEVFDSLFVGAETDSQFYDELLEFLDLLTLNKPQANLLLAGFELKLLDNTGFTPSLDDCIYCKQPLEPESDRIAGASGEAGYLCSRHFQDNQFRTILVPDTVIKIQRFILTHHLAEMLKLDVTPQIAKKLISVNRAWIEGIIEKHLKSPILMEATAGNT